MASENSYVAVGGGAGLSAREEQRVTSEAGAKAPERTWGRACCDDLTAFKEILFSCINVLLVFVPIGWKSQSMGWSSATIFFTNFIAIIPLAGILGAATESLADHTGQTIGGLINASFGNAVEIIITVDAIKRGLCNVVQAGLIGSVLSNLLLVLGMAFIASGILRKEQSFNKDGAMAQSSALLLAGTGMAIPTLFAAHEGSSVEDAVHLSRICAFIMAAVYVFFLIFQLSTHSHHFEDVSDPVSKEELANVHGAAKRFSNVVGGIADEGDAGPTLSPISSTLVLMGSTLIVAQLSELMVGSIEEVSEDYGLPKAFIGLILLPIVGNAAEHMTAVSAAFKGKMDLAIGVAVGSSTQIALLVVPLSIMIGWYYDEPMSLNFGTFYTGIFLLAVFLVGNVMHDGASNWLEGVMLIATYLMIAVISCFIQS